MRTLERLNAEWRVLGRSQNAQCALRKLRAKEKIIRDARACDLYELLECDWTSSQLNSPGYSFRHVALRMLVKYEDLDQLFPRAILQAMIPGFVMAAKDLNFGYNCGWEDKSSFLSDALSCGYELILDWSGQDRPYIAGDLKSALRMRMRRQMLTNKKRIRQSSPLHEGSSVSSFEESVPAQMTLARLIEQNKSKDEGNGAFCALYASAVLGYSKTEIAKMGGISRRQVSKKCELLARTLIA